MNAEATHLAYLICRAVSIWFKACCLLASESKERMIFDKDGRFGLIVVAGITDDVISSLTPSFKPIMKLIKREKKIISVQKQIIFVFKQ